MRPEMVLAEGGEGCSVADCGGLKLEAGTGSLGLACARGGEVVAHLLAAAGQIATLEHPL